MQSLIRNKSAGVTGGRGTAGAGPGRDRLSRAAAVNLIHWKVLPSLNTSSTLVLWIVRNCPIVSPRMALCTTMLCVLYVVAMPCVKKGFTSSGVAKMLV